MAPNPARGVPKLELTLPDAGPVSIELFDMMGRRVGVAFDHAAVPAGRHDFELRGSAGAAALRPGLYFCRVQVPRRSITVRFLVVD